MEENTTNPKIFCKTIKNIFPSKSKGTPSGININNGQNLPDIYSKYFANAVRHLKENSIALVDFVWRQPVKIVLRTQRVCKIQNIKSFHPQRTKTI